MPTTTEILTEHSPKRLGYTTRTGILTIECQCDGRWRDAKEHAQHQAAAGAGAEVDRGAHAVVTDVLREFSGRRAYADVADLVLRALAARGDATTPTEVQWGVRLSPDQIDVLSEPAARLAATSSAVPATLVQRTVSAWREVR